MPNWCYTDAKIYGSNDGIKKFLQIIDKARKVEETKWFKENVGFSSIWLGSIALAMGYAVDNMALFSTDHGLEVLPKTTQEDLAYCRGSLEIDDEYNNSVMICVESAWAPPTDLFDAIKDYCDISCDYIASEPMCDIFVNTNPEVFDQIFNLTTDDDDYYPASEEELLSIAKDYGLNPRSYEELEAMIFNDKSGDLTCWTVHAYTNEEDEPWYLIRRKEEEKS